MNDTFEYTYLVKYWDECSEKMHSDYGTIVGKTVLEVIKKLESYYGYIENVSVNRA